MMNEDRQAWKQEGVTAVLPAEQLMALNRRRNLPGILYFLGHCAATLATGYLLASVDSGWAMVLASALHGLVLVYWFQPFHECSHRSAFRTQWLNRFVYWFSGLLAVVEPTYFYYEHMKHHRYTQHPQLDPERIPSADRIGGYLLYLTGLPYFYYQWSALLRHAVGAIGVAEQAFIPQVTRSRVVLEARCMLAIYAAVFAGTVMAGYPGFLLVYWLIPRLLGEPFMRMVRMSEHQGMPLVPDLFRNTRSVVAWMPLRYLGWQACFHAEHHLSPNTPFHAVPELHRQLAGKFARVSSGYLSAHRSIARAVWAGELPRQAS